MMQVLSHPAHDNSKCCIVGNWMATRFSVFKEASSVLTNWRPSVFACQDIYFLVLKGMVFLLRM